VLTTNYKADTLGKVLIGRYFLTYKSTALLACLIVENLKMKGMSKQK
jgi:hypothetical protein